MAEDLTTLSELNEKTIVEAINKRYKERKIYTYIGDILIAVNPYESLPLYGSSNWLKYTDVKCKSDHEPHIYVISDRAYQNMRRTGFNQCCVVSGESGAGKTESTKLMIEHIAQLCKHDESTLHEKIVEVNPLLEAFGNAQTVINNNSSRFGKFIELIFDESGQILGAKLSEYLLEKSRLVNHGPGEKNFHIFYYLFAGLDDAKLKLNLISDPESHRIMIESDKSKIYKDTTRLNECKQTWKVLQGIMKHVGFSDEEVNGIEAVLAAILHISDIRFLTHPETEGVYIENDKKMALTAQLLAVNAEKFIDALIISTSTVGHETITSMKNELQANDGRDALAKALYGRMFSWIVLQINNLLAPKKEHATKSQNWIGILDIYGFENFKNNSFEQMCINVANEQLQLFFNQHIFKFELDEYAKEGVSGSNVAFIDNQPLLDLFLELKDPPGIFALLDEESKFPQASDQTLIDKLVKNLSSRPDFQTPKGQSLLFTIKHFAGPVTYNVEGFLEKNRDTLSDNVINCLKDSNCLIVYELFSPLSEIGSISGTSTTRKKNLRMSRLISPEGVSIRAKPVNSVDQMKRASVLAKSVMKNPQMISARNETTMKGAKTLTTHFKASLCTLIEKMLAAHPHFIRCIKPNASKESHNFNEKMVLEQLNYTGVLETIKIRKLGYSSRLLFTDFIKSYGVVGGILTLKNPQEGSNICKQIMAKTQLTDWQVGKTKVFLKHWHIEKLNASLTEASQRIVTCQKYWRATMARRNFQKLRTQAEQYRKEVERLVATVTNCSVALDTKVKESSKEDAANKEEEIRKKQEAEEKEKQQNLLLQQQQQQQQLLQQQQQQQQQQLLQQQQQQNATTSESVAVQRRENKVGTISAGAGKKITAELKEGGKVPIMESIPESPSTPDPKLPDIYSSIMKSSNTDPAVVFLQESLGKINTLPLEIWCKLYLMEKNAIIGKLYVRDREVLLDDTDLNYTGTNIGINSQSFDHLPDSECSKILKNIGKGIQISHDAHYNVYLTCSTNLNVYVNGGSDQCLPKGLDKKNCKLPKETIKIFDVEVFKTRVANELKKNDFDIIKLSKYSVFSFSVDKCSSKLIDQPFWVAVIHIGALDLLGRNDVYNELTGMKLLPAGNKNIKDSWDQLSFNRFIQ